MFVCLHAYLHFTPFHKEFEEIDHHTVGYMHPAETEAKNLHQGKGSPIRRWRPWSGWDEACKNAEGEGWGKGPNLTRRACLTWRSGGLPAFPSCVFGSAGECLPPKSIMGLGQQVKLRPISGCQIPKLGWMG